jgi:hypothetical protein
MSSGTLPVTVVCWSIVVLPSQLKMPPPWTDAVLL